MTAPTTVLRCNGCGHPQAHHALLASEGRSCVVNGCYCSARPDLIPLDPADTDQLPPADLTSCDTCGGTGDRWVRDGNGEHPDACGHCDGTGEIGAA